MLTGDVSYRINDNIHCFESAGYMLPLDLRGGAALPLCEYSYPACAALFAGRQAVKESIFGSCCFFEAADLNFRISKCSPHG